MTDSTSTNRQRVFRESQEAKGLVRAEYWATPQTHARFESIVRLGRDVFEGSKRVYGHNKSSLELIVTEKEGELLREYLNSLRNKELSP